MTVAAEHASAQSGRKGMHDRVQPSLCVIVPVSERPEGLDELYGAYRAVISDRVEAFEFVFIFEPWNRHFAEPLKALIGAGAPIRILEVGQTMGESALLEAAAQQTEAPLLCTLPPYARIQPEGLADLVTAVELGADVASARRSRERDSWINRLQSAGFHALLRRAAGGSFRDIASGVRVMRREVLDEVPLYGDFFRFLPLLAERKGFRVLEVPVPQHERDARRRIYAPGVYVRRLVDLLGLFFLVRFTHKPLRFFGLVGAGFSVLGGAILTVLAVQRIAGRPLADRPILLLGLLLFVLGVQAVALGLIGEIIVHFNASQRRTYRLRSDDSPD